jgi:hypothetical protein
MAATIRWLLVILPSLIGTLKSTLKKFYKKEKVFKIFSSLQKPDNLKFTA